MAPNDSPKPIDDDSQGCLEDVKKKKSRHFAMIVKGVEIRKLIVQKKPIKPAQIAAAKSEGAKGDAYYGVCNGSGPEVVFEIVSDDGKEPCKTNKLREFLEEHAGLKFKPVFKFVSENELSAVDDVDDAGKPTSNTNEPVGNQAPPIENTATENVGNQNQTTESNQNQDSQIDSAERTKLLAALSKLTPLVKQAITVQPDRKNEVLEAVAQTKGVIESTDPNVFADGKTKVVELGKKLQEWAGVETRSREDVNAEASQKAGVQVGTVKKRAFLVTRFREIPIEIKPHLAELREHMQQLRPEDNMDKVISAIEENLQVLYDELRDRIDDSINTGDSTKLKGLEDLVMKNELVSHLFRNPLTNGTPFRAACIDALREVEQALAG